MAKLLKEQYNDLTVLRVLGNLSYSEQGAFPSRDGLSGLFLNFTKIRGYSGIVRSTPLFASPLFW